MDKDDWCDEVEGFLICCVAEASSGEQFQCVRQAARYMMRAPAQASVLFGKLPEFSRLECLLELEALDSAVSALLDDTPHGILLSQAIGGSVLCTVVLPGTEEETHFQAESRALAWLGAVMRASVSTLRRSQIH